MFFSFSCPFSSFFFQEDAILEDVGEKGEGGKKALALFIRTKLGLTFSLLSRPLLPFHFQ